MKNAGTSMERPHRYHRQLMSVFVSAGLISAPGTPLQKNQVEVLHLFRWFTHTHIHTPENRNVTSQFWTINPHFVRKSCAAPVKIAVLLQFLKIDHHFARKGCVSRSFVATAPALREKRKSSAKERREGGRE